MMHFNMSTGMNGRIAMVNVCGFCELLLAHACTAADAREIGVALCALEEVADGRGEILRRAGLVLVVHALHVLD